MSKEDLILDIMEKTYDKVEHLTQEVSKIKLEQVRHSEIHRVNADNLEEHMSRTEANEELIRLSNERIQLMENRLLKYDLFINVSMKIIGAIAGITLFILKVIPYITNLLTG